MHKRFDRGSVQSYERLSDGRLRVNATFSRVGELSYLNSDGTIRTEILEASELFNQDSLNTAGLAPVTLGHPSVGFVTPENWKKYAVGASGSTVKARVDDGLVDVVFVVGDRDAIQAIENDDAREVSAGYTTKVVNRDGRLFQTERRYNHLALVSRGRAGADVRVHFDGLDDWAIQVNDSEEPMKYKDMEMSAEVVDAFKKMEADMAKLRGDMKALNQKADAAEGDLLVRVTAERDVLQGKIDQLEKDLASRMDASELESKAAELAKEKLDAFASVSQFLPKGVNFDAKYDVLDWKKAAIAAQRPNLNLDDKEDSYILAAFDMLNALGVAESPEQTKADQQRSDAYREILTAAQNGGNRSDSSLSQDDDNEKQQRADQEAINSLYAWNEGGTK